MKKNHNIRNIIIIMQCITIILMGIGFTFLATILEEEKNTKDDYEVLITKVEAQTSIKGGNLEPTANKELIDNGKTIKFKFNLHSPNDELAYLITIKNTGNLPAKVIRLISSPDYINEPSFKSKIEPITIALPKVNNKVLQPDEELTIKLLIKYNMTNNIKTVSIPYQLTVLASNDK